MSAATIDAMVGATMRTPAEPVLRPAVPADAESLSELARITFYEAYEAMAQPSDLAAYTAERYNAAQLLQELTDPRISIWLALCEAEAVGFLQLADAKAPPEVTGSRPLKLDRLYLRRSVWGQGLGRLFMDLTLRVAAERGYDSIWLSVWDKNPRALLFYQNWGFIDIGWEIFPTGEDRSIDRLMQRFIAPPGGSAPGAGV